MKTLLTASAFLLAATTAALADNGPLVDPNCTDPCTARQPVTPPPPAEAPMPTIVNVAPQPASSPDEEDTGWHRPAGQRFTSGFRLGWMYIANYDAKNRTKDDGTMTSLKDEFGLKSPNMFLIGYEGFYRIVGHSWLNVLMVGNISVAGLDQSKFIPTASGLLGFEIQRSFELGVGVNLTPDSVAPSHMIVAAGWTPRVGSIQTPIHFFFVPDTAGTDAMSHQLKGNSRMGATLGMNW
jgi:hypothetical protein